MLVGGWVLGRAELRNIVPGTVGMKAWTAIGLLCAALFVDHMRAGRRASRTPAASPRLAIDAGPRRGWRPAELVVLPAVVVACMRVIGYTYEIPDFYGPASAAKMALNTAVCFLLLGAAIALARPHGHVLRPRDDRRPRQVLPRRLGPLAVGVPLALGWMRAAGDAGVFTDRVGTWWLTAATIACFVALIWRVNDELGHRVGEPAWTTASIGIATLDAGAPADRALSNADAAMYAAKRAGGDRVELSIGTAVGAT